MIKKRTSADEAAGRLLSWVAGKKKVEQTDKDDSPTGTAVGELISWISGKKK